MTRLTADKTVIVVPTYWTWPSGDRSRPSTASYDHPTPLDSDSTLPALLDDLAAQEASGFRVLILTGLVHPDLGDAVAAHIRRILEPYRGRLDLRLCDAPAWARLREIIEPEGLQLELLDLGSYSGVRNLQLLIPHILNAQAIVALDDDERVAPDYLDRALSYLGQTVGAETVLGVVGPYRHADGGFLLSASAPTGNIFQDKARYINDAMRALTEGDGRLARSPVALGGNMIFHRELFVRVCFDPGITRGEDTDYLINARLQGIPFWFDPNLTVLHLPPRHHDAPPYERTRADVFRFIYDREKLRLHGQTRPAWLEPYPAPFLGDDLIKQASVALRAEATPEIVARLGDPDVILAQAQEHAERSAGRYPSFLEAWTGLIRRLESDASLRRASAAALPRL